MNKAVLVISGYNNRGIIAYLRFFKRKGIPFYIISSGKDDLINYTVYKDQVVYERVSKTLEVKDFENYRHLIEIKNLEGEPKEDIIILPSTEFLNRFLLKNREALESLHYTVPLIEELLYATISDKYSFADLCKHCDIQVPKEFESHEGLDFPFVAKPKSYFVDGKMVNKKPFLVYDQSDYQHLLAELKDSKYFFQSFIGGASYYLLFYFTKDGQYSVYSQQNFIQQDLGLSIIGARSSNFHKAPVVDKFIQLFQDLRFFGLVMVEIKHYKGVSYMIEANPRIWGPSQLIIDAKMDLMDKFALDNGLISSYEQPQYLEDIPYFWSGGLYMDKRNGLTTAFHEYNKQMLNAQYENWENWDIYKKDDCINLYNYESREENE